MSQSLTVTPAYGRDYKTAKAARADWDAGKDFIVADFFNPWDGKPISKRDADGYSITLRFSQLRKVAKA